MLPFSSTSLPKTVSMITRPSGPEPTPRRSQPVTQPPPPTRPNPIPHPQRTTHPPMCRSWRQPIAHILSFGLGNRSPRQGRPILNSQITRSLGGHDLALRNEIIAHKHIRRTRRRIVVRSRYGALPAINALFIVVFVFGIRGFRPTEPVHLDEPKDRNSAECGKEG